MPSLELFVAFLIATFIFAWVPGPAMLYTASQTIGRGRRAGWMAVLGIHVGGYAHIVAAALGLAALFAAIPALYAVVKLAGAGYLIWLGLTLFFGRRESYIPAGMIEPKSPRRAFWDGVAVELLNPKTALFFLTFLPQFTDVSAALPLWGQLLVLGAIVNIMFSSADVICVLLAVGIVRLFRRSVSAHELARRVAGGILIALGINLAVSRQ
jgi:threonine/homoserine/homoserine lactone efflux protein